MSWSINDFRKDLVVLKRWFALTDNYQEKEALINEMMALYQHIAEIEMSKGHIYLNVPEVGIVEAPSEDQIEEDELTCNMILIPRFKLIYPHLGVFKNKLKLLDGINGVVIPEKNTHLKKKDVIELVDEFYKSTTKEIYDHYKKFNKNFIKFDSRKDVDDGSIYSFPILNKKYIEIGTKGDKRKMLHTLAHECGHAVGDFINPERVMNDDFFDEIESLFFELIGEDFFSKELNDDVFKDYQRSTMYGFYRNTKDTLDFKNAVSKVFNNMNSNNKPLDLLDEYLDKDNVEDIDIEGNVKYIFSYIIALELYDVYRQDKEKAIHLLKRLINTNEDKTEYQKIVETVTPNKSLVKTRDRFFTKEYMNANKKEDSDM